MKSQSKEEKEEEENQHFEKRIIQAYKDTRHQMSNGLVLVMQMCKRGPVPIYKPRTETKPAVYSRHQFSDQKSEGVVENGSRSPSRNSSAVRTRLQLKYSQ